jgi:hypothetical protein
MGIAGDKPRQLAPTVGMTGSESTGSPAPSSSSTTSRSHIVDVCFSDVKLFIIGKIVRLIDIQPDRTWSSHLHPRIFHQQQAEVRLRGFLLIAVPRSACAKSPESAAFY